ncbi:histone deacetylase102 [Zea mays]|uniref:Histone deacetylase102 n=1 Tax=Zea mays TaxID=4577 RepID=A0A1D6FWU4_MAIZE|nr:histone deacetylase102 [Zea mays]
MEFWGLEVKPGSTVKCEPGHGFILHVSQAALGESKKSDSALMYVKVDDKKLAIGTLSIDKYPQIQFDLVFNKEFELSHTSKTTSVFFSGKADGKEEQKNQEKAVAATASKSSLGLEKKSKDDSDDSDEDESDDSDEDDSDDSDEGEGLSPDEGDDDSSDEDDTSDDDEEETPTPKKPEAGKKRGAENALKTPLSDKKAKVATPPAQKTGLFVVKYLQSWGYLLWNCCYEFVTCILYFFLQVARRVPPMWQLHTQQKARPLQTMTNQRRSLQNLVGQSLANHAARHSIVRWLCRLTPRRSMGPNELQVQLSP